MNEVSYSEYAIRRHKVAMLWLWAGVITVMTWIFIMIDPPNDWRLSFAMSILLFGVVIMLVSVCKLYGIDLANTEDFEQAQEIEWEYQAIRFGDMLDYRCLDDQKLIGPLKLVRVDESEKDGVRIAYIELTTSATTSPIPNIFLKLELDFHANQIKWLKIVPEIQSMPGTFTRKVLNDLVTDAIKVLGCMPSVYGLLNKIRHHHSDHDVFVFFECHSIAEWVVSNPYHIKVSGGGIIDFVYRSSQLDALERLI